MREKILKTIEKNSRIPHAELAAILGTDEAALKKEIAALEAEGIIRSYNTVIDWEKTSDEKVTALIEVRIAPQRGMGYDRIAARIYNYPEVDAVYLISGDYDLMVIVDGTTLRSVASFVNEKLATIEGVLSTATHFILKKYKEHGTVLDEPNEDTREKVTP
jgi:DNA-binding Lrp family transcriptional regulator